jgi:hypothetical protein
MITGCVYVGRPTIWGNPFVPGRIVEGSRHAAELFTGRAPINERGIAVAKQQLAGFDLACWCVLCDLYKDGKPLTSDCPYRDSCHADISWD